MAGRLHGLASLIGFLVASFSATPAASLWIDAGNHDSGRKLSLRSPPSEPVKQKRSIFAPPRDEKEPVKQKLTHEPIKHVEQKKEKLRDQTAKANSKSMAAKGDKEKKKKQVPLVPIESYRYTLHKQSADKPTRSLILLGPWNGSSGFFDEWLLDDFGKMEPDVKKNYRILDVVARKMPSSEGNPYPYNAWYEYEEWHSETPVEADVDLAIAYVHGLIEQEAAIVGHYQDVIVAGFSQGSNVALEAGLRFHSPLGLVFSQRGVLLAARKEDLNTPIAATPYLLTAGADDDIYYSDTIREDCKWLESMWASAYMKTFPGLDHYRRGQEECKLTVKSLAVMASSSKKDFASLTEWTEGASYGDGDGDGAYGDGDGDGDGGVGPVH